MTQLTLFPKPKVQSLVFCDDNKSILKSLINKGYSVDSIVTDPPYELSFMGKTWDSTGIAYDKELWELCLQILKPGGHLLAFGGSRTYHRMACAIEDAGFEIRDQIMWIYGQGFPKSLNVSKAIDKMAGAERDKIIFDVSQTGNFKNRSDTRPWIEKAKEQGFYELDDNNPVTNTAKQWDGWGSAMKPAHEPIVIARKPLSEKNIALNVLKHGTGGINIDGCRIGNTKSAPASISKADRQIYGKYNLENGNESGHNPNIGRFPANLIHDGSEEVMNEFAKYGERKSGGGDKSVNNSSTSIFKNLGKSSNLSIGGDTGSAARFFYSAKASSKERNGSKHPTVKPISLMRYLCRLVTPPNGIVLDLFAGSGTTGQAAQEEGFNAILIEKEFEYYQDIRRRLFGD